MSDQLQFDRFVLVQQHASGSSLKNWRKYLDLGLTITFWALERCTTDQSLLFLPPHCTPTHSALFKEGGGARTAGQLPLTARARSLGPSLHLYLRASVEALAPTAALAPSSVRAGARCAARPSAAPTWKASFPRLYASERPRSSQQLCFLLPRD